MGTTAAAKTYRGNIMGKMRTFIGVVALLFCQTTFAGIIYDTGLPNNAQWRNSDFSNQFVGQAADDFVLNADAVLTGIGWYGSYLFTDVQPLPDDFTINIYADVGNMPASLLDTAVFSGDVSRTFTGDIVSNQFGDFEMYQYDVDISGVALSAGTKYWLSIVNNTSDTTQFGGWAWAYNRESATHRWIQDGGAWTVFGSGNLAFSLNDDPVAVPEPSGIALLIGGLLGLGLARRTRRRS